MCEPNFMTIHPQQLSTLTAKNVNLMMALMEKSGDHQSQLGAMTVQKKKKEVCQFIQQIFLAVK